MRERLGGVSTVQGEFLDNFQDFSAARLREGSFRKYPGNSPYGTETPPNSGREEGTKSLPWRIPFAIKKGVRLSRDRRHLEFLPHLRAEARERQREHGGTAPGRPSNTLGTPTRSDAIDPHDTLRARDEAGKMVGVSGELVRAAKGERGLAGPEQMPGSCNRERSHGRRDGLAPAVHGGFLEDRELRIREDGEHRLGAPRASLASGSVLTLRPAATVDQVLGSGHGEHPNGGAQGLAFAGLRGGLYCRPLLRGEVHGNGVRPARLARRGRDAEAAQGLGRRQGALPRSGHGRRVARRQYLVKRWVDCELRGHFTAPASDNGSYVNLALR